MRHLTYHWQGQQEQLLTFDGTSDVASAKARILFIPPLFDEMNRIRHMLVQTMRHLHDAGISNALPDLPACNESQGSLDQQNITIWQDAIGAAAKAHRATHIISIRGGCLIDSLPALPIMRLAPVKGQSILNMLIRTRIAGDKEAGIESTVDSLKQQAQKSSIELAGHMISADMWDSLSNALPSQSGNITELKPADIDGTALWLRAEPEHSPAMSAGFAKAISEWCKPI